MAQIFFNQISVIDILDILDIKTDPCTMNVQRS